MPMPKSKRPPSKSSQCAKRASKYINSYRNGSTTDDLVDLLTDVLHFCRRTGYDYDKAITTARMHFKVEKDL